jgi:putative Holliday junction resolvase
MAIDFGTKRTGIAVTDPGRIIATGLTTVASSAIMDFLKDYFSREAVDVVVVGEPKRMDNTATHGTLPADQFVKQLKKEFPGKRVERLDERFTSKMAVQTMIDSGLKKKQRQNKELVDEISATILLQNYLEYNQNNK